MIAHRALLTAPVESLLIGEPVIAARVIGDDDMAGLVQLYMDANRCESIIQARVDVEAYLGGLFGPPIREVWLGVYDGHPIPVSAVMYTTWKGMPVIMDLLTAPSYRNRGYASSIIRETAITLKATGVETVGVLVERGSPSMYLLEELGFSEAMASVAGE